jgi:hypothetical protein
MRGSSVRGSTLPGALLEGHCNGGMARDIPIGLELDRFQELRQRYVPELDALSGITVRRCANGRGNTRRYL